MMCSAYKLNKQDDNKHCTTNSCTPFSILNYSVAPYWVLTVSSWPSYSFLGRQVSLSGIPISFLLHDPATVLQIPKWAENLHSHTNLHTDVYSSFSHNCQNLEVIKIAFSRWIDKETMGHLDSGILLSAKKKKSYQTMKRRNFKCILPSERSQLEKATYCMTFNYMAIWKKQNYGDSKKKLMVARGWREGEMKSQSPRMF